MILVTGASGFLGQHLVRELALTGNKIKASYLHHPPSADLKSLQHVEWVRADLLDIFDVEELMKGVRQVYHCAATVSFDAKQHETMMHNNIESTINVVNESLLQGVEKLIHVSSIAALGVPEDPAKPITEEEQWEENESQSAYGKSKHLAELEVWRGIAEGLTAVIVNPGIILGEGDWENGSSKFFSLINDGFPFVTKGITGWVDVKDVVRAMILLMKSPIDEERFILSSGNYSYQTVFQEIANALKVTTPRKLAKPWQTELIWRWQKIQSFFSQKPPAISKETAQTAQKEMNFNNQKLLQHLSEFEYTELNATIKRVAKSFSQNSL